MLLIWQSVAVLAVVLKRDCRPSRFCSKGHASPTDAEIRCSLHGCGRRSAVTARATDGSTTSYGMGRLPRLAGRSGLMRDSTECRRALPRGVRLGDARTRLAG